MLTPHLIRRSFPETAVVVSTEISVPAIMGRPQIEVARNLPGHGTLSWGTHGTDLAL